MQTKTKLRHVWASFLALTLCVTMLIGSTYAWFTDTVTSTGNIIKSGTLSVGMLWADGDETPDDTANWIDVEDDSDPQNQIIFGYELWEPGYVQVRHIKVVNKGSLALKYNLTMLAAGDAATAADLAEVIDVYTKTPAVKVADRGEVATKLNRVGTLREVMNDTTVLAAATQGHLSAEEGTAVITIALKMQETAGNEYQDKQVNAGFDVKLFATQWTEEEDTFDNQYDKMATYDSTNVTNDLHLSNNGATVTVPAGSANVNDVFVLNVTNNGNNTDTDGKTTASFDVKLFKNGTELSSADVNNTEYTVEINVGKNLDVVGVYHNGVPVIGYTYDSATGIVTFKTKSFSPFTVEFHEPKLITFNGNGSTDGSMDNQNIYAGVAAKLNNNAFSKTGYTFAGWATTSDGEAIYTDGARYTMNTEGATLYAVWTEIKPNGVTIKKDGIDTMSVITEANKQIQLNAEVDPGTALNKSVLWRSSDESIATVDQTGLVTTNTTIGETTITATCSGDTSVYSECKVAVLLPVQYREYDASTERFNIKTANVVPITTDMTTLNNTGISNGWYAVTDNVTFDNRIEVKGTVNLILCDRTTLTASKGIRVGGTNTLNIYSQSDRSRQGILNASTGNESQAAIGGSAEKESGGNITINGGAITATSSFHGAGIGGAIGGNSGIITINGGEIRATGYRGAAIGGGSLGSGETITINGGMVTATAIESDPLKPAYGAGIGGGKNGSGGNIAINGGTVRATGSSASDHGIGSGCNGSLIDDLSNGTLIVGPGLTVYGDDSIVDPDDGPKTEILPPYDSRPRYMKVDRKSIKK